ncbi:MAG: hypothetical protein IJ909_00275 [Fibrobacter sp.]|nr:hypothetical protein [Fibrobacter sp.]
MKHKLLTLASAAALLAACSDSSVSDANDEIKDKGTVTFFVYDALTRQPIEKASVYHRTTKETKKTDAKGGIVWKGVDIGTSYFDITYDNYADIRHTTYVDDQIVHDVARVDDNTEKVAMYELGVNVKGKLYYVDPETKEWKPAPGVTVYVDYPDSTEIFPNEIYEVTKEDGSYEFTNLAANVGFQVKSERFTVNDTVVYEVTTIDEVAQRKGVTEQTWKELDPVAAEVASLEPVLLSSNLNKVGVKDDIKLTFSEELEKDSVTTKHFEVKRIIDDTVDPMITQDVAISVSLSDGKVVSIKSASGEWADGKEYMIKFDVWTPLAKELKDSVVIDGVTYEKWRRFTAGSVSRPDQVKELMIDLNDDKDKTKKVAISYTGKLTVESEVNGTSDLAYNESITIKWNGFEKGVDSYNVYVKGDVDAFSDYRLVENTTDTTSTIKLNREFNDWNYFAYPGNKKLPKTIKVIVLPVNAAGEALAKDAKALEIPTYEYVSDSIKNMQTNDYLKTATVVMEAAPFAAAGGFIYDCPDDDLLGCSVVAQGKKPTDGKNYAADIVVSNTHKDDYPAAKMPSGYELYYNKGTSDNPDWVKCAEDVVATFVVTTNDDCSPFKDGARKYDPDGSKVFGYAIVPFFDKGFCSNGAYFTEMTCVGAGEFWESVKISQTDMSGKSAGMFINEDNFQKMINEWGKTP